MIKNIQGNLFYTDTQVFAHQVNCQGVMGAGIAKQIRNKYPNVYELYRIALATADKRQFLGHCQTVHIGDNRYVANLFGQYRYGRYQQHTDYSAVRKSMTQLRDWMKSQGLTTCGMPYGIGCGLAGGDWHTVYDIINDIFGSDPDITCYIVKWDGR